MTEWPFVALHYLFGDFVNCQESRLEMATDSLGEGTTTRQDKCKGQELKGKEEVLYLCAIYARLVPCGL